MTTAEMTVEIKKLINQYAPVGTAFKWGRATKAFGYCSYKRDRRTGKYYDFVITISHPLASRNTWEVVKRTVLHEIAHARTAGHHHDKVWQRECLAIGGDGKRCYTPDRCGGDVVSVPYKYIGVCPCCGKKFPRNRRTNGYHCNRLQPIVWKLNNVA